MDRQPFTPDPAASNGTHDLTAAYAELQNLLLESPDVTDFLQQVAVLSAAVVPATACGITMRRDREVITVAASSPLAREVDEIQYGRGQGPCLESLHTGVIVDVPDLANDDRWPKYQPHALAHGIRSSLSIPLTVDHINVGALNLYGTSQDQFGEQQATRASAFALKAATALTIVIRHAAQQELQEQLRDALATRAVIDQALGIIMGQQRISAEDGFEVLRYASQHRNIKLAVVAADLIESITGHPPAPPRPFTQRN